MKNKNRKINFIQAINEALITSMTIDKNIICYGLGVTDPKAVFGSTAGLEKKFGALRVFDTPTSENALTGIGVGAALNGIKPIYNHQRLDFFLLSMDQLVNSAAKWHYMFGSKLSVPITFRLIIGKGWGQGPTHSQNLQAWFSHIPGLKVVMPSNPFDAKGLLISSIFDPNPVIFLEHRWLHNLEGYVPKKKFQVSIGKSKLINLGTDITVVSSSYLTVESIHAINHLKKFNIHCDLIDLRTVKPLDFSIIKRSVKKTGKILVIDSGFSFGSVASEIISTITQNNFSYLKCAPQKLAMPDVPEPTSIALTKNFSIRADTIIKKILKILNLKNNEIIKSFSIPKYHDIPGDWFKGPF